MAGVELCYVVGLLLKPIRSEIIESGVAQKGIARIVLRVGDRLLVLVLAEHRLDLLQLRLVELILWLPHGVDEIRILVESTRHGITETWSISLLKHGQLCGVDALLLGIDQLQLHDHSLHGGHLGLHHALLGLQ